MTELRRDGTIEDDRERLLAQVRKANSQLVLTGMEAKRRAAELEAALSSIADGVVVYGPGGEIVRMNRTAEEILGFSPEMKNLPHEQRVRVQQPETEDGKRLGPDETPSGRALRGETVRGLVMVLRRPEKRLVWISASAAPIKMTDGEVIGAVATYTDVTELHELQEQRERALAMERRAREEAERAVRARDEFMSLAAHELKTPVTSIRGFAQTLVRQIDKTGEVDQARLVRALEIITYQTRKLAKLTEQLLNVSRLEAGKLTLSREEIDLTSLVEDTVATFRSSHPERTLRFLRERAIPISLDALRMEQVFTNLLDNALKFSPTNTPVEVQVEADDSGCWATASVRDFGIGVPEGQQERIFERYHQAHTERHYGGMGIGLYVCRQIVELHGGSIMVELPQGGGSRFVVHLPLAC